MTKCNQKTEIFSTDPNTGGGGGATNILPPTAEDQIPVATQNAVTGTFEYTPRPFPLAGISAADAGRGVVVNAAGTGLEAADVVFSDEGIDALLDQVGVVTPPTLTFTAQNVLTISAFKAHFPPPTPGSNSFVLDVPRTNLVITQAGTGNASSNITYVLLDNQGNFIQTPQKPTPQLLKTELFVAEVSHPVGSEIEAVRPLYTLYSNIVAQNRQISESIGLLSEGFEFTLNRSNGIVTQTGTDAKIVGYGISTIGNRNEVPFPAGNITVEYFSFDPNLVNPSLTDFRRQYQVDDVTTNTSSPISINNFGILVVLASIGGKYVVIAPQAEFDTFDAANASRIIYASQIKLPESFREFYAPVATIVVANEVTTNTGTEFVIELVGNLSFNGGFLSSQRALPDPSSGNANDVVAVDSTASSYVFKTPIVSDLSGAQADDLLEYNVAAQQFQPKTVNVSQFSFLLAGAEFIKLIRCKFTTNNAPTSVDDPDNILDAANTRSTRITFTSQANADLTIPFAIYFVSDANNAVARLPADAKTLQAQLLIDGTGLPLTFPGTLFFFYSFLG